MVCEESRGPGNNGRPGSCSRLWRDDNSVSKAEGTIAGSVGSGVDHLGFSYDDLDAAMKRFSAAGVKIVSGIEKDGRPERVDRGIRGRR